VRGRAGSGGRWGSAAEVVDLVEEVVLVVADAVVDPVAVVRGAARAAVQRGLGGRLGGGFPWKCQGRRHLEDKAGGAQRAGGFRAASALYTRVARRVRGKRSLDVNGAIVGAHGRASGSMGPKVGGGTDDACSRVDLPLFMNRREGRMAPERRSGRVAKLGVLLHPIPVLWFELAFLF
jgi:hypothetical protein